MDEERRDAILERIGIFIFFFGCFSMVFAWFILSDIILLIILQYYIAALIGIVAFVLGILLLILPAYFFFFKELDEEDIPIEIIQKLLGHKDIANTMIYTEVTNKKVFNAMKGVN